MYTHICGCTLMHARDVHHVRGIYAHVRGMYAHVHGMLWNVRDMYTVYFFYHGNECGHRGHCRGIYSLAHPPVDALLDYCEIRHYVRAAFVVGPGSFY